MTYDPIVLDGIEASKAWLEAGKHALWKQMPNGNLRCTCGGTFGPKGLPIHCGMKNGNGPRPRLVRCIKALINSYSNDGYNGPVRWHESVPYLSRATVVADLESLLER